MADVTRIPAVIEPRDPHVAAELLPPVYGEPRQLAARRPAQEKGQRLRPTALVHEACLRPVGGKGPHRWNGCRHLSAAADSPRKNTPLRTPGGPMAHYLWVRGDGAGLSARRVTATPRSPRPTAH